MQYFLSKSSRAIAAMLANGQTLCAFDFDGTLAPIVERPEMAALQPSTRALLIRLAALYPAVVVSGRARADVAGKLEGIPLAAIVGNHGAERESSPAGRRHIDAWIESSTRAFEPAVSGFPGVWIEDKGFSLAIHYRLAANKAAARRAILKAAATLAEVKVFGGKQVVNLSPKNAPHKGHAVAAERDRLHCNWILYVGDDDNDEDAFALEGNMVPIRIGQKRATHARYYLRRQPEIDRLLELLIDMRRARLARN